VRIFADAAARLVAEAACQEDLADLAGVDILDGLPRAFRGANLRSGLADAPVLARRLDHATPFENVVADRLLDVDIFARLHRPDRGQRVPVVRRSDRDDIYVCIFEQAAYVLYSFRRGPVPVRDGLLRFRDDALIHVADGDDLRILPARKRADMAHAPAMHADAGDMNPVVRPDPTAPTFGSCRLLQAQPGDGSGSREQRLFQKAAACDLVHRIALLTVLRECSARRQYCPAPFSSLLCSWGEGWGGRAILQQPGQMERDEQEKACRGQKVEAHGRPKRTDDRVPMLHIRLCKARDLRQNNAISSGDKCGV